MGRMLKTAFKPLALAPDQVASGYAKLIQHRIGDQESNPSRAATRPKRQPLATGAFALVLAVVIALGALQFRTRSTVSVLSTPTAAPTLSVPQQLDNTRREPTQAISQHPPAPQVVVTLTCAPDTFCGTSTREPNITFTPMDTV